MLGYVRAYKPEMKFKDFDLYKGVYCSLCKEIGKRYGLIARLTLSYDFTFFAMLRMSVRNECVKFSNSRCSFNPAKKCLDCGRDNIDLQYTADVSMLMMYFKLIDNIDDSKFFKRMFCKMLMPYAKHIYKKATRHIPEQSQIIAEMMKKQSQVEKNNLGMDEAADPSARMLSELLSADIQCDNIEELKRLGYCVGRWVYQIDAVDDCEKDIKTGNFNPLKSKYNDGEYKEYCSNMLNLTIGEAVKAYEKIQVMRFKDIISNILYYGTEAVMNRVFKKEVSSNEKSI